MVHLCYLVIWPQTPAAKLITQIWQLVTDATNWLGIIAQLVKALIRFKLKGGHVTLPLSEYLRLCKARYITLCLYIKRYPWQYINCVSFRSQEKAEFVEHQVNHHSFLNSTGEGGALETHTHTYCGGGGGYNIFEFWSKLIAF